MIIGIFLVSMLRAQTPGVGTQPLTAMQNYWRGRDLEVNSMSEANVFYNEAIRISLEEISRNAATRDTYTAITWSMQRQGRFAEVIAWGERGLRVFPDEYRIVQMMGEAFFYLNDYERSMASMQRYVNAMPQGERASTAYFFIGEIFRITEKYHHADIAYTTALQIAPGLALWWFRLGLVREAVGDRIPAIEAYQQALRINPNYSQALSALARLRQAPD